MEAIKAFFEVLKLMWSFISTPMIGGMLLIVIGIIIIRESIFYFVHKKRNQKEQDRLAKRIAEEIKKTENIEN